MTHSHPRRIAAIGIAATLLFATAALAAKPSWTVGARPTPKLGTTIVVDAKGRALYALHPETTKHMLCTPAACVALWPPLTVSSRKVALKAGPTVRGKLGLVRRGDGRLQVTLRGKPLYRYSGDSGPNDANGEGVRGFGGTWHAVTASAGAAQPAAPKPSGSGGY